MTHRPELQIPVSDTKAHVDVVRVDISYSTVNQVD